MAVFSSTKHSFFVVRKLYTCPVKEREVSRIFDIGHWAFECQMSNIEYLANFMFLPCNIHTWQVTKATNNLIVAALHSLSKGIQKCIKHH